MSDVGDVHRAHGGDRVPEQKGPEDAYVRAARKMVTPAATITDRLAFATLHTAKNVVMLANIIDALRAENAQLMDQIYGVDTAGDGR